MRKILVLAVAVAFALPAAFRSAPEAAACPRSQEVASYEGSKSCQKCHFKEYGTWQKTKMAKAFESLKPNQAAEAKTKAKLDVAKDYTKDPGCVACHVTGYGKPGGYPELVAGKEFSPEEKVRAALNEGVSCEACHGPGGKASAFKKDNKAYRWEEVAKLGMIHPDESNCASCHNAKSPTYVEFKFADKIGKDTHDILKMKADHACPHAHGGK